MQIHNIKKNKSNKTSIRVGRGGKRGTYSGKGLKGQKARSGVSGLKRLGMRQLIEQTHKQKGFKSRNPKPEILNLNVLNDKFKDGDKITPQVLKDKGVVDKITKGVKILGNGEIKVRLEVENCLVSKTAKNKIVEVGGTVKEIQLTKENKK